MIVTAIQSLPLVGITASVTLVLSAAYLLSMYRSVFFGEPSETVLSLRDISYAEGTILLFIGLLIIAIGVYSSIN